jgi:Reverse transcriptase (RNA-dependent DNA polymerase)
VFPQQVAFPSLDQYLYKLHNKLCVSLDISSSFYVIPIKEEDRYKTAFWVNENAYEFNVLVMGLKSSPYHLQKFIKEVFSKQAYEKYAPMLSEKEQALLPASFENILVSYFDDVNIAGDNTEQLLACTKLCMLASRGAKIKYSIEKSSFLTNKIKLLGYEYDTKICLLTVIVTM